MASFNELAQAMARRRRQSPLPPKGPLARLPWQRYHTPGPVHGVGRWRYTGKGPVRGPRGSY